MTDTPSALFGRVRPDERDEIISALRAGLVPARGAHLLQVGREREVRALLQDLDRVAGGGSTVRFVTADYGAGKSFTLHLLRSMAHERKLVSTTADLTAERRLAGRDGYARNLYRELSANMATRFQPDGRALKTVIERFTADCIDTARGSGVAPDVVVGERLVGLTEMAHGFDLATVVRAFGRGHVSGDDQLCADALRWLRGEFDSRRDARAALGVGSIIDDTNVYPTLKLLAKLCRLAGYQGLLVCVDELVAMYRLGNAHSRTRNYETLLHIVNDALQGTAGGLGMVFALTPEMLYHPQRGLYSYPALQQRLTENSFAKAGLVDVTGPVLRLSNLTEEELFVLLQRLRHILAAGDREQHLMPDEALVAFMEHCARQVGDRYVSRPRLAIKEFVDLLVTLEQHPHLSWTDLLPQIVITDDAEIHRAGGDDYVDHGVAAGTSVTIGALTDDDGDLDTFRL